MVSWYKKQCDSKKNISKVTFILYVAKLWKADDSTLELRNKDDNGDTSDWKIVKYGTTTLHYIEKVADSKMVLGIDGNIVGEEKDQSKGEFVEKHQCRIKGGEQYCFEFFWHFFSCIQ